MITLMMFYSIAGAFFHWMSTNAVLAMQGVNNMCGLWWKFLCVFQKNCLFSKNSGRTNCFYRVPQKLKHGRTNIHKEVFHEFLQICKVTTPSIEQCNRKR